MNSKDRFLASLNHKEPDRLPVDFGGTLVSGMHVTCVAQLRDYYGLDKKPVKIHEPFQMLGLIEEDLSDKIGVDVAAVNPRNTLFGFANDNWKPWRLDNGLEVLVPEKFNTTVDQCGNTYIYPEGDSSIPPSGKMPKGGFYFDAVIRQEPIDDDNLHVEDNLEEFAEISEDSLIYFEKESKNAFHKGKGVIANFGGTGLGDIALVPAPFLKHPKGIRDVQEWYISTAIRQDYIHRVFENQTETALKNLKLINNTAGKYVDAVFICGTDFGTQHGTFCSADTFKDLYMPYYKKMNEWIHKNTGWKTFKHCCGAIESFISLFIEAGFDILNPVQCSAAGMDPYTLKEKYGDKMVFWGGGADTQKTLPFGKPEEVREQVLRRCEIFSKNGGFIFNAIHNIQAKTPVKNIIAMIEAVREFNGN